MRNGKLRHTREHNAESVIRTESTFDLLGRLVAIRDHAGNIITLSHDSLSRKIAMSDPDMGEWSYDYDNVGNLVGQTDAKGQTLTMAYDGLKRVTSRHHDSEELASFTYDQPTAGFSNIGQLTTLSDKTGSR